MSRTYKYPRESLDEPMTRDEPNANLRIQKKLERKKQQDKQRVKTARSFKEFIRFRDRHLAKGL